MAENRIAAIRDVMVMGHAGCGKTTLVEQMLFKAGVTTRAGSVDDGTSVLDSSPEEKSRQITIDPASAHLTWKGRELNLIDTPGYPDFVGMALSCLPAAEMVLVCISASAGIEVNTRKAWQAAGDAGKARMIAVTRMDGDNIHVEDLLAQIQETLGAECIPLNLPAGAGADLKGVVSTLVPSENAPDGVIGDLEAMGTSLRESVIESDEDLMDRYLEEEEIKPEELEPVFRKSVASGEVVPVLFCAAEQDVGVEELMDAIAAYAPAPGEAAPPSCTDESGEQDVAITPDPAAPFAAQVFRCVNDPFVGRLSFFRVFSGSLPSDGSFQNVRSGRTERAGQLFRVLGKQQENVPQAEPGDLVAVTKVEDMKVGDTLCAEGRTVRLAEVQFPTPMTSLAIEPKSRGDEQKISASLSRLAEEDPTFRVVRDQQTNELVVSGTTQMHLEVMLERMKRRYGVEANTKEPKIPYKETVTIKTTARHRHKKQTGGRGQFGEVWIRIEPLPRGEGFEFVNEVVGGAIPSQYIPAVEKGIREAMARGVLAGCLVVDLRVTLYDGKFHEVDSSEAAFKIAGSMAFQKAFLEAKPALLEPVVTTEITVPTQYMGDITGDLNGRRGRIQGMDSLGELQVVQAEVPMAEVTRYATELRSMTGGTGSYTMEFLRYDIVPQRLAEQIIARAKAAKEKA